MVISHFAFDAKCAKLVSLFFKTVCAEHLHAR